jgi:type I restriction enzyme S subunit
MREMQPSGYPVYGANGRIGFTDTFTHEAETLLIGCRGSCGTLHICEPHSYVNGNAMALDDLDIDRVNLTYLLHFLRFRGFADVITGSSQPQITREGLSKVEVPLPLLSHQVRIAALLNKAQSALKQRIRLVERANDFLRSVFFDLFGDPVSNSKFHEERPISELAVVTTGNTPSRTVAAYYGDHIEWIKSDNLNTRHHFLTKASEGLSESGLRVGRSAPSGSTLITCIAGSPSCIGNAALADRRVAFNQQINALTPTGSIEPEFLYATTLFSKARIQAASTSGMKGMVSKGALERVQFILPAEDRRKKFAGIFRKVVATTEKLEHAAASGEVLYAALAQQAFQRVKLETCIGH